MEPVDYIEQSIQSQRNQFTPNNQQKKPIFFGRPPNLKPEVKLKVRKPIKFDDNDSLEDNIESLISEEMEYLRNL